MFAVELLLRSDPAGARSNRDPSTHELASDRACVHVEALANDSQRCAFRVLRGGDTNVVVGELAPVLATAESSSFEMFQHSRPTYGVLANELSNRKTVLVVTEHLIDLHRGEPDLALALQGFRGPTTVATASTDGPTEKVEHWGRKA